MDLETTMEVEFSFQEGMVTFTRHCDIDGQWIIDINRHTGSAARPMQLFPPAEMMPNVQNAFDLYAKWLTDYPVGHPRSDEMRHREISAEFDGDVAPETISYSQRLRAEARELREKFRCVVRSRRAFRETLAVLRSSFR